MEQKELHTYIIAYDLRAPERNYQELYEALRDFPNWGKLTESVWAIHSAMSCVEVREFLVKFIDKNDRLIVILGGKHAAWINILAEDMWAREALAL